MKARVSNITGIVRQKLSDLSRNKKALALSAVVILGLIPLFTWFKPGCIIAGDDWLPPFYPLEAIKTMGYMWDQNGTGGVHLLGSVLVFPFYAFWALFKAVGLSMAVTERLWFLFFVLGAGLSMYYLMSVLFPESKYLVARVIAPVFYMYNASIVNTTEFFFRMGAPLSYAFTPLILGLFITGLRKGKKTRGAVFIALASLLLVSAVGNAPSYIIPWALVTAYFVFHLVSVDRSGSERLSSLAFFGKTAGLCLLVNIWWLPTFVFPLISSGGTIALTGVGRIAYISQRSSFLEVFRLMGKQTWLGGWYFTIGGREIFQPYFPFALSYYKPVLILITYLIPILAFSAALLRRRDNRVLFLTILALIFTFLAKGLHPPLEAVNEFLYTYIPGFAMYREPSRSFGLINALCYAPLIGITVATIYDYLKQNKARLSSIASRFLIVLILGVILTSSWVVVTGAINLPDREYLGRHHVKIPAYWLEAAEYINEQEGDFRVLLYPKMPSWGDSFDWGNGDGYIGQPLTRRLIYKPQLLVHGWAGKTAFDYEPEASKELQHVICNVIYRDTETDLASVLGLLNIRYILQRNDLNWHFYEILEHDIDTPEHTRKVLTSRPGISLVKSFGKLDLYRVDDDYFVPHIYTTDDSTYMYGDLDSFIRLLQENRLSLPKEIFISQSTLWDRFIQMSSPDDIFIHYLDGIITTDAINYNFSIREAGDYDIYLNLNSMFPSGEELLLNGQGLEIKDSSGWSLWTGGALSLGSHTISLPLKRTKFLNDPSYEEGVWGGATDRLAGEAGTPTMSATQSTDAHSGKYSLRIATDMHIASVHQNLSGFIPGAIYHISFWYKHIKGDPPRFSVYEYGTNQVAAGGEEILPYETGKWMYHEELFATDPNATNIAPTFSSGFFGTQQETVNLYDDVRLVASLGVEQIRIHKVHSPVARSKVHITHTKLNPTKYQVQVNASQPFFLMFSESYSTRWKAYINTDGGDTSWIEAPFQKPLPEDRHFMVNGYANTWHINPDELGVAGKDFSITLYYQPQSWFYLSIIVSGLALLGVIGYLIRIWIRDKRKGV